MLTTLRYNPPGHFAHCSCDEQLRLRTESVAWITTVTGDGQPQSSPVWFLWDGSEFLVYAQPRSWQARNIRVNPG